MICHSHPHTHSVVKLRSHFSLVQSLTEILAVRNPVFYIWNAVTTEYVYTKTEAGLSLLATLLGLALTQKGEKSYVHTQHGITVSLNVGSLF